MSEAEVSLWQHLRQKPMKLRFRRDHPFYGYAIDFYCPKAKLAVEVDGIVHDMGDRPERDLRRDAFLAERGIETIRIPAKDVLENSGEVADSLVRLALARIAGK